MVERGGRFYFYFSANGNIGVAVADSPTGPFTDLGRPLIADGDYEGQMIDPAVFVDDDGRAYLYWGNGTAYGVELNENMTSFDPAAVRSWRPVGYREAAWVHRRDDRYYLTWSENDTRSEDYRVCYAVGDSPLGSWRGATVILQKDIALGYRGTGHHSIAQVPGRDEWVIAFHRFRVPNGHGYDREVMFAPLEHGGKGELLPVTFVPQPFLSPLVRQVDGNEVNPRESKE
jgi:beta-xylosidase